MSEAMRVVISLLAAWGLIDASRRLILKWMGRNGKYIEVRIVTIKGPVNSSCNGKATGSGDIHMVTETLKAMVDVGDQLNKAAQNMAKIASERGK